jgi:Glycosyltransferase family 17
MRAWDCVVISAESDLDLLEARFTEYQDLPVVHVIAEAAADYQGSPKPLHFLDAAYQERFWPWHGRWNHVRVEAHELPADASAEIREAALRDYLSHAVAAEPDDIILHGDADEIPAAWAVREILTGKTLLPVGTEMRWYYQGKVHVNTWRGTVAQRWRQVGSFAGLRDRKDQVPALVNAGTKLGGGFHPDGHGMRAAEIDETWPKWVRMKFPR